MNLTGRLHDVFVEDFRKELAEIQSPEAKRLFVLAKANHLSHMRTAEYVTLAAAADISGHQGAGVRLESCLADHLAFVERTKRADQAGEKNNKCHFIESVHTRHRKRKYVLFYASRAYFLVHFSLNRNARNRCKSIASGCENKLRFDSLPAPLGNPPVAWVRVTSKVKHGHSETRSKRSRPLSEPRNR